MPQLNLTGPDLDVLARTVAVTLEVDEKFGLLAGYGWPGFEDYRAMSPEARRTLAGLFEQLEAVAQEHSS